MTTFYTALFATPTRGLLRLAVPPKLPEYMSFEGDIYGLTSRTRHGDYVFSVVDP